MEYTNQWDLNIFLKKLMEASLILGNASAGFYAAPAFSVSTINVGSRQKIEQNWRIFSMSILTAQR